MNFILSNLHRRYKMDSSVLYIRYAIEIGKILSEQGLKISTVESCTGGLLSSKLTDNPGSSAYITLNLVTYANDAKVKMLGVVLNEDGVVSESCAKQMVEGLHILTNSDICVSTTGIAGPTGGSKDKPVGLMYSAIKYKNLVKIYKIQLDSSIARIEMKELFVKEVLKNLYELLISQS